MLLPSYMIIRDLSIRDYDELTRFWRVNYFVGEIDSVDKLKTFLEKNPKLSVVAIDGAKIVGTALGSFDGRRGYLQKLVVAKDYRGKGLGRKLVDEIIKRLRSAGATYIPIAVEESLVPFYTECGFKKTNQIPMNLNL